MCVGASRGQEKSHGLYGLWLKNEHRGGGLVLRENHLVDHVDDAIIGFDVGLDDIRVVHLHLSLPR